MQPPSTHSEHHRFSSLLDKAQILLTLSRSLATQSQGHISLVPEWPLPAPLSCASYCPKTKKKKKFFCIFAHFLVFIIMTDPTPLPPSWKVLGFSFFTCFSFWTVSFQAQLHCTGPQLLPNYSIHHRILVVVYLKKTAIFNSCLPSLYTRRPIPRRQAACFSNLLHLGRPVSSLTHKELQKWLGASSEPAF